MTDDHVPTAAHRLHLPSVASSADRVGRFAVEQCQRSPAVARDAVNLLVREVTTNALVHGTGTVTVSVVAGREVIRVEVTDENPALPDLGVAGQKTDAEPPLPLVDAVSMALLDTLSTAWGVEPAPPGKTVWFEVPTSGPVEGPMTT